MISILIVNWNTRDLLRACLRSLGDHPPSEGCEIIVVDNASHDGSAQMVQDEFPSVKLHVSGSNLGYAAGNNAAFARAIGDLVLTLNPDTEVPPGALDTAAAKLRSGRDIGCVSLQLVGPDGKVQRSVRGFPTFIGLVGDVTGLGKALPGSPFDGYRLSGFDYSKEADAPQPMGTFLMFRREALAAVGDPGRPFDERFPIFFNEVDLLARLRTAGWRCIYTPEAQVLHHGGESTRQVRRSMIWESHRSLLRYLRKHGGTGPGNVGYPFLAAMIYASAFIRAKGYDAGFRP